MKRSYELKQRGESQLKTRQKIVEAAIHLHQTKGLVATSMNDIAEQANVGKVTVYRHFPSMTAMIGACSGQYFERHPFPDAENYRAIKDPLNRFRQCLIETYDFHASTDAMMTRVHAEARNHPVMRPYHDHWSRVAQILFEGWKARGKQKILLRVAIGHALDFETWHSLVCEQSLSNDQAVDLMLRLTCECP